ncbi:hypothetical protein CH373_03965 [Leptospira perolatii]|uniref:Uncharacterized protein n=1 Tax=Leptospira perolatii TaxID=2023191 RepID=A0A2M9ZPT4_9LEPT|nr:hypothetical protein [Leptospira perolatii]PJZ69041.1 hypothetical protein CH360_13365 [Leptospira perolatii]PJZ74090.1 hypothetical protein CH373_03965 [Leptospira perolatii]
MNQNSPKRRTGSELTTKILILIISIGFQVSLFSDSQVLSGTGEDRNPIFTDRSRNDFRSFRRKDRVGRLNDPEFRSAWRKYSQNKDARSLKYWFETHPELEPYPCVFKRSEPIESYQSVYLDCPKDSLKGFIYSGNPISNPEKMESFRVIRPVKIKDILYWELDFEPSEHYPSSESGDSRPNRRREPKRTRRPSYEEKAPDNFGLQYFLSISRKPENRPTPHDKQIFFDSTCPLIYLGKDADFYWDKALYFSFQASCATGSPYSWIRIRADFEGSLTVDNRSTQDLKEGERLLAKLKIQSIDKDKIVWSDAELFHE